MNHEVPDTVLERIKKMLRLAEDAAASEGERDNAMRMARNTLAKYNLDMADLESHQSPADKVKAGEPRVEHVATFYGRPWARQVTRHIARMCACEYLVTTATKGKNTKHWFIGRQTNAITAAYLAEYLVKSIDREGHKRQRAADAGNDWFRAFAIGAAHAIAKRVDEMLANKDEQTHLSEGKALVLVNWHTTETEANKALIAKLHPVLRSTSGGKGISSADGYAHGQAYGRTVSLNRQLS